MAHAAAIACLDDPFPPRDAMNPARPPISCSAATALSGPLLCLVRKSSRRNAWATLAQSSLCLLALTMASTSCLVTSTPDFTPPKRTRPFLVTASADPDPRKIQVLDGPPGAAITYDFSADVVSEDQGAQVLGRLFIDYGRSNMGGQPFNQVVKVKRPLDPGTMGDPKPRRIEAKGTLPYLLANGCHTATLMVSHQFTDGDCPTCLNDSSQISWPVYRCNSFESPASCLPDFSDPLCADLAPGCSAIAEPDSGVECGASP